MSELILDRSEVLRIIAEEGEDAIQCRNTPTTAWRVVYWLWMDLGTFPKVYWRRTPKPVIKRVPLCLDDISPGSAIKGITGDGWALITEAKSGGIVCGSGTPEATFLEYGTLANFKGAKITRPAQLNREGEDGWYPCYKETKE
jgi:hypothetical protein